MNQRVQFKNYRCSDGLPCTAFTCRVGWCKFPERKTEARSVVTEKKTEG